VIIIPKLVTAKAEQTFGPPSSQISTTRKLYLATLILLQTKDLTQPVNPNGVEVSLKIETGESVPSIIGKLWEAGLISNPGAYRSYLQYSGLDTSLKAGEYQLSPGLTAIEITQAIQSSISADITLTILPGWRLEEIANSLPSSGFDITAEEFYQDTHSHPQGYSFSSCMPDDSLEGYLFPGSYTVPRGTTIEELLPQVLMNFESQVTIELRQGFDNQGLDLCQAVTLASIVQREAVVEDEMPIIASVFYNRLNSGAVLASDPTIQYALGYNPDQGTWWTNPLSAADLQLDSPYNTYLYPGLPPGPISNPGMAALRAVAFPAQTPYFYFRAACDGSGRHSFSETYEEHVANECP
jgi:peptidoglycan lytic transglycosylase G